MFDFPLSQRSMLGVVCGPMRSGKSDQLVALADWLNYSQGKLPYKAFKPFTDDRTGSEIIRSRAGREIPCTPFAKPEELYASSRGLRVLLLDEIQFANVQQGDGEGIVEVLNNLCKDGKHVLAYGLDLTSEGAPFGPMGELLAHADYVHKIHPFCETCGSPARYTALINSAQKVGEVLVGDKEYRVACRACYS